ncbi:MAG: DUF5719 family protein [Chloroflexi bacterium]|nr:DUF5719 family protein [Chloroflexota bacterium]
MRRLTVVAMAVVALVLAISLALLGVAGVGGGAKSTSVALAAPLGSPPGTWVSSITVQNPSTQSATVKLEIVDQNGAVKFSDTVTVAAGASKLWYVPNLTGLASGRYSAVISSDPVRVVAIANLVSSNPSTGGSYSGVNDDQAASSFYIPSVYREYYGYTSNIVVQNADTADASVTVTFKNKLGTTVDTKTTTIKSGASYTFDQAGQTALGSNFVGSAVVEAAGGKKVVAIFNISSSAGNGLFSTSNGFSSAAAGTVAYLPVIYNDYYSFLTSFLVQNVDTADANVQAVYKNHLGQTVKTATATIKPGQSNLWYQPNDGLGSKFHGSVTVTSTNGKNIVAVANILNNVTGRLSAYNGFTGGSATIALPVIMNMYYGWVTSLTVMNVDTAAANVTLEYKSATYNTTKTATIQPGTAQMWYQPNDGLPQRFNGSVKVTSTGGVKVVAVVNEEKQKGDDNVSDAGPGDWLMSYNGSNQ